MKKLIYGGLFLALVGIIFIGCKKELNQPNVETKNSTNSQTSLKSGYNFHYAGPVHNIVLDNLMNHLNWKNMTVSEQSKYTDSITKLELLALNKDTTSMPHGYSLTYYNHALSYEGQEVLYATEVEKFLADSVDFSSLTINYYGELLSFLLNSSDEGSNYTKSEILSFAMDLETEESISDIEKQFLRGAISVAYYSISYWVDYDEDNPAPQTPWWKKAIADVTGFVDGFVHSIKLNSDNGFSFNPLNYGIQMGGFSSKLAGG